MTTTYQSRYSRGCTYWVLFGLSALALCTSTCIYAQKGQASNNTPLYSRANAPIEGRVQDLLARMTLKEKVWQLDVYKGAVDLVDSR